MHAHTRIRSHSVAHVRLLTKRTQTRAHLRAHACTHAHTETQTRRQTDRHTHILTHARTHAHTHTHTHTHTEEKERKKKCKAFVNLKSVQHSLVWFAGYFQVTWDCVSSAHLLGIFCGRNISVVEVILCHCEISIDFFQLTHCYFTSSCQFQSCWPHWWWRLQVEFIHTLQGITSWLLLACWPRWYWSLSWCGTKSSVPPEGTLSEELAQFFLLWDSAWLGADIILV